jgi:hypothetical protein
MEVKQEVEKKTEEIKETLKQVNDAKSGVDVTDAKKVVQDANLNAVTAVVETKEAGKVEVSDAEVKTMVEKAINETLSDGNAVKEQAQLMTSSTVNTVDKVVVVVPQTKEEAVSTTTVSVKDVVADATKQVEATQKTLESAKDLVNNNQLLEAIQAVKAATDATTKVEQTVQQVKTSVEEVAEKAIAPVVSSTTAVAPSSTLPAITTSTTVIKK